MSADDDLRAERPVGIVVGDDFMQYIRELRETWPEQSREHVEPDGKRQTADSTMSKSAEPEPAAQPEQPQTTDSPLDGDATRRKFMIGVGVTTAAAVAGTGVVAAEGDQVANFDSDFTPNPWLTGTATIEEHHEDWDVLDYQPNSGGPESLGNHGAVLARRDEEDDPHNPVRFRADLIDTPEYTSFPRGVTREDEDGDDEDVSALDAEEWTIDGDELTVEDDGDALHVETDGLEDGASAMATFDNFEIDSGEPRKVLQLVANVDELEADAVLNLTVLDAAGNYVEATIDADAVEDNDDTITTEQGSGVVYQNQLGELDGGEDLDTIEEVEIEVMDADVDVTIYGLNLDREDRWSFGDRERLDDDDELEVTTVREPTGYTGVTDLDGIKDSFGDVTIEDLELEVEFRASELPNSDIEIMVEEPERGDYDQIFHMVGGFDLPSAYELSVELDELKDTQAHPQSRYREAEIDTGLDEIPTMEDIDDIEWTDVSAAYDGDEGDTAELSSTVSASDVTGFHIEIEEDDHIVDEMWTTAGGGGAAAIGSGDGVMSNVYGWVAAVFTGALTVFGLMRARASSAVGR